LKASIIIPTYNSKKLLESCLISLNHQTVSHEDDFEVVVIDDGSDDGTDILVGSMNTTYEINYFHKKRDAYSSRSAARNKGVNISNGDIIIFLDGDQIAPPTFVSEHLKSHKLNDNLVVIGFREYLCKGEINTEVLQCGFTLEALPLIETYDERIKILERFSKKLQELESSWHLFWTCNVSVSKNNLLKVGGFDENFLNWGLEDCELGYKLYKNNLLFIYNKDAIVYHQYHSSEFTEKTYHEWRSNLD
jgi:GT2 family glycosyltransferase